jgi:hypothetical protein
MSKDATMRLISLLLVLVGATPLTRAQESLRVGEVTAAPGQKLSGWIPVPDGPDPGTRIPFAGEVPYVVATPPVSEGEPLAFVGRVSASEPKP